MDARALIAMVKKILEKILLIKSWAVAIVIIKWGIIIITGAKFLEEWSDIG